MIRETLERILGQRDRTKAALSYAQAKELARSGDPDDRRRVALDPDVRPELLYFLARDASASVRAAVAAHPSTPRQADMILALDESPEVRTVVAEKVTQQIESIPADNSAQLWQLSVQLLEALARDDLTKVRQIVAETARGLEKIPRTVAFALARDREAEVAVPALGYPGHFDDEELIEIVEGAHDPRIVGAVAQRPRIGARVSEAVVEAGDERAIALLLGNQSAEIAPQTFDKVVARAPQVKAWQELLVKRPDLPEKAAAKLGSFVSHALGDILLARSKPEATGNGGKAVARPAEAIVPEVIVPNEAPLARAKRLQAEKKLTEDAIVDALGLDQDFVIAALSLRASLAPAVVQKILASHSAKGMTALAWKAGCTMRLAVQLQTRVGRLAPKARLTSTAGGGWPMTPDELSWQIEFFRSLVAAG
jgi:uncharacterized protein (DUF2336 family)